MYVEIFIIFSTITSVIILLTMIKVIYNYFISETKYDLPMLIVLVFFMAPSVFSWINVPLIIANYVPDFDTIKIWFLASILMFFMGMAMICLFILLLSRKIQLNLKFDKIFLISVVIVLSLIYLHLLINYEVITIEENGVYYISTRVINQYWNVLYFVLSIMLLTPIGLQYQRLSFKVMGRVNRTKLFIAGICIVSIGFMTFHRLTTTLTWELLMLYGVIELTVYSIVFYVFYHPNFLESLLMLLNIESVYIADSNAKLLHITTIMGGKNKKIHDELVGGLVKGADGVISEIMAVRKVGLSRIILNDGTAIILEKSEVSKMYYIVFTHVYTKFTNQKVLELKEMLDKFENKPFEVNSDIFESAKLDEAIRNNFVERKF